MPVVTRYCSHDLTIGRIGYNPTRLSCKILSDMVRIGVKTRQATKAKRIRKAPFS